MVKRVAMVFGIVFLVAGILGFFSAGGTSMVADPAPAMLLGVFGVNLLHNIVHLLFGVWGVLAARRFAGAKQFAQITGTLYLILAVCGFLIPTTFGLMPIGGSDIWLHAAIGLVLSGVGFTAKEGSVAPAAAAAKV